ncbi:threonine--tRNA ligase [Ureaplasma zalophigenitalium]|uniref:Threonine--tRNA ligase n=1 Tax=Ureaplasma zalophigenitalium TaxID=907723 RepID=A0ABT3BPA1_9BACT|nr:threonine--tRNA ligase [Ureaplasma zalophigenitalium]MCV3754018.1 threonine--tRNA ligase [Ureaplasma zalophigenitalium]
MDNLNAKLNWQTAFGLAYTLKRLYKNIEIATINLQEEGFYVDFKINDDIKVSVDDFKKIKKELTKLINNKEVVDILTEYTTDSFFVNDQKKENPYLNFFQIRDFVFLADLDKGFNLFNSRHYELLNMGGSYYKNNAKLDQLVRISGICFASSEELSEYLEILNERKERDHRKIGKELDLFTFNLLAGQGLPIWKPNGTIIKQKVQQFINELEFMYDFTPVITPILGSIDLYKTSGHWDHYQENIFPPINVDDETFVLRPMTCPHHTLVYSDNLRSYRNLPVRLCEHSILHRYESSGGLTGFERVREMILEDCHVFCRLDQIEQEVQNAFAMIRKAHEGLKIKAFEIHLSLYDENDHEKFYNDPIMWKESQDALRAMLNKNNIPFKEMVGEAAFYGPKIDFQVKTSLNRIITISTIQLDFLLPKRFGLSYIDSQKNEVTPVMIHIGIIGTYERFLAILLEQTKGILPFWLAPTQVIVIPVNEEIHGVYARNLHMKLKSLMLHSVYDDRNERISKKIREAQINKIPYQIVVGDKEIEDENLVTYREYGQETTQTITFTSFIDLLQNKIKNKE